MAAGENKPKSIVRNLIAVVIRFLGGADEARYHVGFQLFRVQAPAANTVNGFMLGCLDDPRARRLGYAAISPLVQGGGKRFLRAFFRQIEIAKETNQGGDDPPPLGAISFFNS